MGYGTRSSRVRMDSIDTLTFYNGELTAARRSSPVPQLQCVGKPCKLYQPDVVQCTAVGRNGPDVEWKCQAELPSTIRFGRVEVSCEGYESPDDPFILKGSCGLTYNLVRVDPSLENESYPGAHSSRDYASRFTSKFFSNFFNFVTLALLFYMLYVILIRPLLTYFTRNMPLATGTAGSRPPPPPGRPWFGDLGGWGPGGGGGGGPGTGGSGGPARPGDAPPPYSAKGDSTATGTSTSSSIWSELGRDMRRGAAMGVGSTIAEAGINTLLGRNRNNERQQRYQTAPPMFAARQPSPFAPSFRSPFNRDDDRGEGSSGTTGLGSMRTSSGFGGTRNR